jgi:pilus assembly protein CpaB
VKRRAVIAAAAVVLAAFGAGAVLAYVHQAVAHGLAGQKAATVLVAQQAIPSGTAARVAQRDGLLRAETLPASSVPANGVRAITPGLAALVTSAQIEPGQLLLRPMLVTAAEVTGGVALPPTMVAVTIALCLPEAVAGGVHAGSAVEVFDTAGAGRATGGGALNASSDCSGSHQEQGGGTARTRVVLSRAQVLSVGPASGGQTGPTPGDTAPGGTAPGSSTSTAGTSTDPPSSQGTVLVTFAVSSAAAQRLIQVSVTGLPYLALLQH